MTYIYNNRPGVTRITLFEHTGSFNDLGFDLDFACYILSRTHIGPCYWPTEVPIYDFWPLSDEPLGYIAMNYHGGLLVVPLERKEYDVLVPIYGFTAQDDGKELYDTEMVSRVHKTKLISVWTWLTLEKKFDVQLAPWPFGHYLTATFNNADDCNDNFTDNFNDGTHSEAFTDYTAGSYYPQGFGYPSIDHDRVSLWFHTQRQYELAGTSTGITPSASTADGTCFSTANGIIYDVMRPTTNTFPAEELRWTKTTSDQNAYFDFNPGIRFHWHHLQETYDHKPNSMVSELRKVLGHCMKPGNDMGFCVDSQSSHERIVRMTAVIDSNVQAIDWQVIVEIVNLQMARELWHHMLLRPTSSQPSSCVADVYWDQIVDHEGNPSMTIIALIVCLFYEWCQKSLRMQLGKTGDTTITKRTQLMSNMLLMKFLLSHEESLDQGIRTGEHSPSAHHPLPPPERVSVGIQAQPSWAYKPAGGSGKIGLYLRLLTPLVPSPITEPPRSSQDSSMDLSSDAQDEKQIEDDIHHPGDTGSLPAQPSTPISMPAPLCSNPPLQTPTFICAPYMRIKNDNDAGVRDIVFSSNNGVQTPKLLLQQLLGRLSEIFIPNITVEPPSNEASTPSEHTHLSHLELLSPHRPLPLAQSHEERDQSRVPEGRSGDAHGVYRSSTAAQAQPSWPEAPGRECEHNQDRDSQSQSQYSRSRSQGPI
ncbi:uncharacterized protein EDB91DRAFT_1086687 [Suillus paluster]|uniref:uncharacterized protein n=1 Tax=Suillus paluster TaxID=48578 RepID=UPI001B86CCA1|nr:uncharacterized protein EDB91DRAFT_1086687 [Suillus paluster]KAG1726710.1 hypothetical protein EDB91DRAFT_1086687 [Suillus paluster]